MFDSSKFPWLKNKGYLHITPKINVYEKASEIIGKITNQEFVEKYAFYPLLHASKKERKYKKINSSESTKRSHAKTKENGNKVSTAKQRPLHYATHFDSLIYGYYANILSAKYELALKKEIGLDDSVTAYRKIPIPGISKNKGTIHFADELFTKVSEQALTGPVSVLKFDITNFFNRLDHDVLKNIWGRLLNEDGIMPPDHANVFKAATSFSYILLDDLRVRTLTKYRKSGFDERKLHEIRSRTGKEAFFESPADFRKAVKNKEIRIYRRPFVDKGREKAVGIPQGLPISAVLGNLYLLDFDREIHQTLAIPHGITYRRYSDDIVVICRPEAARDTFEYITRVISNYHLEISVEKTEEFRFQFESTEDGEAVLRSFKVELGGNFRNTPFTYLGFEFYGDKTLIKSANLAKFYRRLIFHTKKKANRAVRVGLKHPGQQIVIFQKQLYRLFTKSRLSDKSKIRKIKTLTQSSKGTYFYVTKNKTVRSRGNYFGYVNRATAILKEPRIEKQLSRHTKILGQAIRKQLRIQKERQL